MRETTVVIDARDYVNLVVVRGDAAARTSRARCSASSEAPRIVGDRRPLVDLPPSRHMLVVHNDDVRA